MKGKKLLGLILAVMFLLSGILWAERPRKEFPEKKWRGKDKMHMMKKEMDFKFKEFAKKDPVFKKNIMELKKIHKKLRYLKEKYFDAESDDEQVKIKKHIKKLLMKRFELIYQMKKEALKKAEERLKKFRKNKEDVVERWLNRVISKEKKPRYEKKWRREKKREKEKVHRRYPEKREKRREEFPDEDY